MSKKSEKESVKQKENNPEVVQKKGVNGENPEKKEPKGSPLIEDDKDIELKKLKEEITKLKNDKLLQQLRK